MGDALGNARDSIKLVTGEAGFNDLSVVMQTGMGSDIEGRVSCKLNRLSSPSRLKKQTKNNQSDKQKPHELGGLPSSSLFSQFILLFQDFLTSFTAYKSIPKM